MTTERIDIQVREDGSRVVRRRLEDLDPAARKAASGIEFLKRTLALLGGAAVVRELLATVNTFQSLENRLRSTGLEGQQLTAVYKELLAASNATRSSVEGSVELYARLAVSAKDLGVSQRQLIDFTTSLNQAIALSGASGQEAQAGLIQLSQGLASGALRGDELRSVLENLPAVADVIAKRLGVTRGELRKLGEDGKITARAVLDAFQASREELNDRFGKQIPTLSQSFQVLRNKVLDYVGQTDKALGVSAALATAMTFLANNLDTVTRAAVGLAAGLVLVAGGAAAVRGLVGAVQALAVAVAANPLGALLVVLVSAVALLSLFRDKVLLGVDSVTTLGDLFRALGDVVVPAIRAVADAAVQLFGPLGAAVREWYNTTDFSTANILRLTAKGVDFFVGAWRGAVAALVAIFEGVPPALSDLFTQALNAVLDKIGKFVNKAGELLSTVTEFVGLGTIASNLDFTLDNKDAGAAARLGGDIAQAFKDGYNAANPAQALVDNILRNAQAYGEARAEVERLARRGSGVSNVAGKPAPLPVDAKEVERAQNALRSLLNQIQPSSGAVLELAKAQKTLNEAQKLGLISAEQNAKYLELTRLYYRDIIDPLGAYNRQLDEQARLLEVSTREREIEAELLRIGQDLQKQGLPLTEQETAQLRTKLQAIRDLNEATQAQDAILAATIGKRRDFYVQLEALKTLSNSGRLGAGDTATAASSLLSSAGIDLEGTQVLLDAQVAQFEAMYAKIDALRQRNLISEQDAQQLQAKIAVQQQELRLQSAQGFFGNLATLTKSGNKRLADIGRAAAIAQATIDGILAVQKALASSPPPYNYVLATAVGIAAAANVANIAKTGYKEGGYTGNGGVNDVAGVVHGREFVVNADATARNRAALEAMNRGGVVTGSGGSVVNVIVNNNADGTVATTRERQGPDGYEVEVTIERAVAKSIRRGGAVASALETQYALNRAAGSVR